MNEYRLNLGTPEAQEFLLKQMDDYFLATELRCPRVTSRRNEN